MNILLLSQFFSTTKGGGEYVFNIMAKALADNGNKVWVITNRIKNEIYSPHENIKIVFVKPEIDYRGGLPTGVLENLRYFFNATQKGISIIKKEGIDIIHSNNFAPAVTGSFLSIFTGKPHITTVHDIFSLCGNDYWKLWGKQNNVSFMNVMLGPFYEKMLLKLKYEAIHTVSESTKDDLLKFGAKKRIFIVPSAIEEAKYSNTDSPEFTFISIGRLVFYKNLEVIIKAMNVVTKSYPQVKLLIVGDGPHRSVLEKTVIELKLNNNVKFTGYVSNEEKNRLLASSKALVFPSLCEGFGLVILEAFAHQKPVLCANIRPLSDIITHKKNGFLISPHNDEEWANSLKNIIEKPDEAIQIGKEGKKLLEEKYNISSMISNIMKMYGQVLR